MTSKVLTQHYQERISTFQHFYERTVDGMEMEDIHQLRVVIKKIRAIWAFLETATGGEFKKEEGIRIYKTLFGIAGEVRETQVSRSLIEKNAPKYLKSFIGNLLTNEAELKEKLAVALSRFSRLHADKVDSRVLQLLEDISEKQALVSCRRSLHRRLFKVSRLMGQLPDAQKLHKIRMNLKAVHETLSIMFALAPGNTLIQVRNRTRTLNRYIGSWHDWVVLHHAVVHFRSQDPDMTNNRFLVKFVQRVNEKQNLMQKMILSRLQRYFELRFIRDLTYHTNIIL